MNQKLSTDIDFQQGYVLPIDKPLNWTSYDIVRKVKNLLRAAGHKKIKVGHAGTLDPLATGVLLVCIGKATKRAEELQAQTKEYLTTMELGATTPCFDMEHPIDNRYPTEHITADAVQAVAHGFKGEQLQEPPIFSAKMIDGKRAYDYARDGQEVKMRMALINIYDLEVVGLDMPHLTIRVECSKGTYIRALARDFGKRLDSGAYLTKLERTRSGDYKVEDCYKIEEVEKIFAQVKQI
ncbi:MAG: tRNA pseudouridine(55) synthase TruB [Rikenellaceae bacterium]